MKKKIMVILVSLLILATGIKTIAAQVNFRVVDECEAIIIVDELNLRTGPGVNFNVIKRLVRNEKIEILGEMENWYVICLNDGTVGLVNKQFVKITKINKKIISEGSINESTEPSYNVINGDRGILFGLTNNSRLENGLPSFIWDDNLNEIARLKAEDMVINDYFDHNSPIYGTPFKMLKEMDILYKGASENLLSNLSMEEAHNQIMGSPVHRMNILSPRFNKMGVGIAKSSRYGKIIVQLFVEE